LCKTATGNKVRGKAAHILAIKVIIPAFVKPAAIGCILFRSSIDKSDSSLMEEDACIAIPEFIGSRDDATLVCPRTVELGVIRETLPLVTNAKDP
jgi:hypothetical protein